MFRTTSILVCTALSISLSLATELCAQSDRDTIVRKDAKRITRVKLLKLDLDKITYSKGGKEQEVAADQVAEIRWGTPPESFTRGHSAAKRGDFAGAAKLFDEAAKATKSETLKQVAVFQCGRCFALASLKDSAHANNAVSHLKTYLEGAANGYHMPEAKVRLAQATMAGGDAPAAETMLAAIDSEATVGSWPLFWAAQIKFAKARSQFAQGKHSDARMSFQAVDGAVAGAMGQDAKHNHELQQMRTESLVMQGETYIGEKLFDDALSYFQTLAGNNTRGVKAAAAAGQGQILFIQGSDKNNVDKLRQAQLALARASIEPDTSDTTSAKALFYMGKVLTALGDDAEKNALARAKTYFQSVKNNYGSTPWADKAREALEG